MARPKSPHSPWAMPTQGRLSFDDFWFWVAVLYQYIWDAAWSVRDAGGGHPFRNPTVTSRTGDPAADLNLYELSISTAPPGGSPRQRDISVDHIESIIGRNFKSVGSLRLQAFWFLCEGVGLDPLNLDNKKPRGRFLTQAGIPDPAWPVSRAHSERFGLFLHAIRQQIEDQVLAQFPDPNNPGEPDYQAWARVGHLIYGPMTYATWWSNVNIENVLLLDLWCALVALDPPAGEPRDYWAFFPFGG